MAGKVKVFPNTSYQPNHTNLSLNVTDELYINWHKHDKFFFYC